MSKQDTHSSSHVLLISAAAQGHINPTLQLAKTISRASTRVTFATTRTGLRLVNLPSTYNHLSLATFSTGFDDGVKSDDPRAVAEHSKRVGSKSIHDLIISLSNDGHPVTLLVYTLMLPWAADVARELHVSSAFLCIQSATSFTIYNSYFNNFNCHNNKTPQMCVELPGMPLFETNDLPTFLLPSNPYFNFVVPIFEEHIRALERDPNPTVLINSFDALEESVITAVDFHRTKVVTIGPLIPSAFCSKSDPRDTSYGCDLFERSKDYMSWLDTKENKSVVYVSFGSMVVMKRKLFEETLHGLILMGRPYLWVVRPITHNKLGSEEDEVVIEDTIKNGLGPNDNGLILPWCSQVEVLSHPAIGCFMTHCGWNSILESIVTGVPVIGVPQMADQTTNAKLVEEVWRVGVRAKENEENIADREEVKRCIEVVMADEEVGVVIRRNCKKWKELALEAVMEGGSSSANVACFLESLQHKQ